MTRISAIITFCIFFTLHLNAQEIGYGFKAGLNFSSFQGDSETDADGNDLEEYKFETGFHIGGLVNFKFVDRFGLRTELLFSQKGGRYNFTGPSFQRVFTADGQPVQTIGTKKLSINVTNSYIDIPVMGYARVTRWLELSAGVNVAFLVSSKGAGELRYSGAEANGSVLEEFVSTLEHNYFTDDAAGGNTSDPIIRDISSGRVEIPRTMGAYYDYPSDTDIKSLYNVVDFGLNAGLNLFLNQGLSLGFRFNYGLLDISNNDIDRSQTEQDNGALIFKDDTDQNISIQASIGFSF